VLVLINKIANCACRERKSAYIGFRRTGLSTVCIIFGSSNKNKLLVLGCGLIAVVRSIKIRRIKMTEWLVAIGTILLAVIAAFQDKIRAKIWSPQLDCDIELNPPDCHRTILRINLPTNVSEVYSFFYRFKIWNKGKISAKNVEVIITELLKKEGNKYKIVESFSPDNLLWSTTGDIYAPYISPETFKHINLGHIHDPKVRANLSGENNPKLPVSNEEAIFSFDVHFKSNILYYLIAPGEYKIELKVGCENAKTITKKYSINFTGKWIEDESRMLNESLKINSIN
jgi:hypothetical protein